MPSNDREVFDKLVAVDEDASIESFLTFAIFAFERRQWIRHHTDRTGNPPTDAEIGGWIENLTDVQFGQMLDRARTFYDRAARAYLAAEIETFRQATLQEAILRDVQSATDAQKTGLASTLAEVKVAGSFWRQAAIALITAILAPIIIGGILAFALVGERAIPTIAGVRDAVMPKPGPKQDLAPGAEAPR